MEDFESTTEVLGFAPLQETREKKQLCLVVVSGTEKGAVFPLAEGATTIGRSAQHADLVVTGRGLSRTHARIVVTDDLVKVEDLGSTNGLFINGQKTLDGVMAAGDTLTLGPDVQLRLDASVESIQSLLQELRRGATQDSLTGLLNRRSFLDRLQEEMSASARHSLKACVAMIDVDHFKSVNDTYGHPAGDAVLVGVAQRLNSGMRGEDTLARFGGEEFAVLLRHTDLDGGLILLDRLRETVANLPFDVPTPSGTETITVTFSAGLTLLAGKDTQKRVLERADVALYEAKRTGRNRVIRRTGEE
ncbi:diguanylate cyclase [bacterium]|nr:diguanylate cyclase [bacterium]